MTDCTLLRGIQDAALHEFCQKGFQNASLRKIVRDAGVTTGAFYGHCASKEALFGTLVEPVYQGLLDRFKAAQPDFSALSEDEPVPALGDICGVPFYWMSDFVYETLPILRLLLTGARGTRYADLLDRIIGIELETIQAYGRALTARGVQLRPVDPVLTRILTQSLFTGFFQLVLQDIPRESAPEYIRELKEFYNSGWRTLMGVQ